MPISIASNLASLNAQRRLSEGTKDLRTVYERLSSGLRINHSGDDAAGLAISDSLSSDRRVFDQGVRNLNDGLSLLSIADSTVESLANIVTRLQELAEQASNGVYGSAQRRAMDKEAQALSREFTRVAQSANFNGKSIFTADFGDLRVQGSFGDTGGVVSHLGGAIGTGAFGSRTELISSAGAQTAENTVLADLNRDGNLDLIASIDDGANGHFEVMMGTGTGTFGASTTYAKSGAGFDDFLLADVNNDGSLDIVAEGSSSLHIQLGNADGTFRAAYTAVTPAGINSIAMGDMNGDGILDVATVSAGSGTMYVQLGNGNGTFGAGVAYSMQSTIARDVSLGDVNNDGILDAISAGNSAGVGDLQVRLGNGDGSFRASTGYAVGTTTYAVTLGDINGDGNLDAVSGGTTGAVFRLNNGDGTFGAATTYSLGGTASDISLADLNGDGLLDLVGNGGGTAVQIRLNQGNGSFGSVVSFSMDTSASNSATLADVNNDGVLDLLSAGDDSSNGTVSLRLGSSAHGLGALLPFSLATQADALQALSYLKQAASRLGTQRGVIGAFQSRVAVGLNVLGVASENYAEAAGRIRNADIAEESSQLVRKQIQQKAAVAILAQANSQPEIALKLLSDAT